ncbi:MAG: hypothetical protein WC655_01575, partial [Candidatus Hydrogenedentales bacterium]
MAPAVALDVPLKYVLHPLDPGDHHPYGDQRLQMKPAVPAGEWKLPSLVGKTPLYGIAEFGDKKYLLVLDSTIPADTFYSRLYFDANANRDLTDEPALDGSYKWEGRGLRATLVFKKAIEINVAIGDKSVRYSFRPQAEGWYPSAPPDVSLPEDIQNVQVLLRTNCSYSGEFEFD